MTTQELINQLQAFQAEHGIIPVELGIIQGWHGMTGVVTVEVVNPNSWDDPVNQRLDSAGGLMVDPEVGPTCLIGNTKVQRV